MAVTRDDPTPEDLRRREPPPFRPVEVIGAEHRTPRLRRITLGGAELRGFTVDEPAASVRLLLPPPGEHRLVLPAWTGNEFLLPDGRRPVIRTLTPVRAEPDEGRLHVDVVLHGAGALSTWAERATPGMPAAVSGPGRGYVIDAHAPAFLLAGDEAALPAIEQLLGALPAHASVQVHVEVEDERARLDLLSRPGVQIAWHVRPDGAPPGDSIVVSLAAAPIEPGTRVWVAGEAAAVQRVRRLLFEERGVPRSHASVRGYWKAGRTGPGGAPPVSR